MKTGNSLAEQKDYEGAYNAYRKAYAFDQTNELAKAMMEKMLRLRQGEDSQDKEKPSATNTKYLPTSYNVQQQKDEVFPQRIEKLRDVIYQNGVDIQWLVKELAKDLDLNVIFDRDTFRSAQDWKVKVEYRNVTSAKALDYLFLQEGLFFQKVGPRTIVVANQNQRQKFQQLVLKTFYLQNAAPKDVAKVITTAIPPQPGRTQTTVLQDEATNSVTVRDTSENIRLIGKLIRAIDKDRAEVVMDVNIYEVTKNDLLQIGNQIGDDKSLLNLGGTTSAVTGLGGNDLLGQFLKLPTQTAAGIILPQANIKALQSKGNSKLLASTQVHAFNNEESTARIGQRVPVQTASVVPFGSTVGGNNNSFGQGYPVINYEQVGLTLKFTPIVFPNQDVQVKMEIESKDVVAGNDPLQPQFTERSIKGTARIQNNRTLLLASVAQDNQSNSRSGLPIVGLIPILGRLFTAPRKDNRQTDIVIAVTPKVLRAPTVLPEDEVELETGSLAVPTSGSLEAMIKQEEREEYLAEARRKNNVALQLPDQPIDTPKYVPANTETNSTAKVENKTTVTTSPVSENKTVNPDVPLKPIDSTNVKTLQIEQTSDTSKENVPTQKLSLPSENSVPKDNKTNVSNGEVQLFPTMRAMKVGEKMQVSVIIKSENAFRSAVLALNYDQNKIAIRKVIYGDVFGDKLAEKEATPFLNSKGKMFVTLASDKDLAVGGSDVLAYIEIESLIDGTPEIKFDSNISNILTEDGSSFLLKYR
jgi:general secretion pathway protein D